MKRNVIEINEEKCVGCGLCAGACMQGAIEIIDGKAKLVSESYCDGLGMCLPKCPVDAIHVVEKETDQFDPSRKNIKAKSNEASDKKNLEPLACGCPGTASKSIQRTAQIESLGVLTSQQVKHEPVASIGLIGSELMQWPVQLRLVSPNAPYFKDADLLIAADCTAFAYGDFHRDFIKGKVTVIGCPKLDDNQYNTDKIAQILSENDIKSITVVRMEVPCCGGMIQAVRQAMLKAQCIVPYTEVTISSEGRVL
ncbi:ATP-binding protein [Fusibacter sp. 3D3]|uniref:ATP-binding protein n=1 Tax=Fusibacter sp. 3D3 TaxID=1048380 RepID=UPI000853CD3B|nr:4Fe-4S binding protein [Fusibacter sp. 3D3]GAU76210.1 ferredoxin 3 fused to uncharacterized domain [Fusibacter sp. 3D3]